MPNLSTTAAIDPAVHETFSTSDRNSLLDAAFDFGLTVAEFKVYYGLVRLMNNVHQVTERMEDIAAMCKHSRTTVTVAIKSLVHKGLVRQLVSKGRAYIHQLTSPLDWVQQVEVEDEGKSNVQMLNISNVQMLNIETTEQQDSSTPPLGGVCLESNVVQEVMTRCCTSSDVQMLNITKIEPTFSDLDSKLAAARNRWNAGTWFNDLGEQMVTVNCFTLTVSEFMKRSLDSFDHTVQACAEGLAMFKAQIEKIKQRRGKLL